MMRGILLFLVAGLALAAGEKLRYDDYRVYRVLPANVDQLQFLNGLARYHSDIRFWKEARAVNMPADIMVSPKMQPTFLEWLQAHSITASVFIENVQYLIDNERPANVVRADFALDDYHTLEEIFAWIDSLVQAYPDYTRRVFGGTTYEGFEFDGIEISYGDGSRVVILEGGMHPRDWAATACMNWFINEILTTNDTDVRDVISQFVFMIYPTSNLDGYNYTWNTDRLWRKNRTPYQNCIGVDLNRNWDFHFAEDGTSEDFCADNYPGPVAFSEYETATFSKTLTGYDSGVLVFYGSFHAYGQMILFPYGVPDEVATNHDELLEMAERARDALAARYGTNYTVGTVQDLLYPASGTSIDWMQGVNGNQYNFAWELRDEGQYGFLLPADQIVPTCQEAFDSLVSILQDVLTNSRKSSRKH
ncbi:zinc carboxypeptidase-like isoform X1 [Schistocerca americana]|uniref:zinc carboxypeptidase-like isoform X1 n=1 Tax=Schistocerca americana TaxID=7009 RepID=UPI001F4F5EB3|nr:zinc carboxypeptidase-like isoform X1 [Schistocerca americana]